MSSLIWQSTSKNHFLIYLPDWQGNSFYFLRVSQDPSQVQIEFRFRDSDRVPWLSADYLAISDALNPLAEAIAEPAELYQKARSRKDKQATDKFHSIVFRLYQRILLEVELLKPEPEISVSEDYSVSTDFSEIENFLNALEEIA